MLTVYILFVCLLTSAQQETGVIVGKVTDGKTDLPDARVRVLASPIHTITDDYGEFTLTGINTPDSLDIFAWAEGYSL
ncbi:hypothetical protein ES708_14279 [subsurface metagenome]